MNDTWLENVIDEVILFIIATRPIQYLGLNLTGFCNMKTASRYFRRRREWIGKFDTIDVSIRTESKYNFITIPKKYAQGFLGCGEEVE